MSSQKKKEKAMYQKMFNLEDKEGEAGGQASSSDETSWTAVSITFTAMGNCLKSGKFLCFTPAADEIWLSKVQIL